MSGTSGKRRKKMYDDAWYNDNFWIEAGIDFSSRKIMLDEDIDEYSTGWVVRALHKMEEQDSKKPIDLYINSYGGSVYDCYSLYDTLTTCKCPIRAFAQGKVMSAGTDIFLACDERYAYNNVTFMFHTMSNDPGYVKLFEQQTDVKECERLYEIGLRILAENTAKDYAFWKKWIKYENRYFGINKAKELGIVTHDMADLEDD